MKDLVKTKAPEACKKRDREGSCRRLLDAGLEIFSKHGYDAATTKLVAKQAGINESLINRYFDGKEGLLLAIIRQFFESEKASGALHYPAGKTLEAEIRNFSDALNEHHGKYSKFFKVVISRALVDPKVGEELKCAADDGMTGLLKQRLADLKKRGLIRSNVNVERACFAIKSTCFSVGFLGRYVMGHDDAFVHAILNDFVRDYCVGIGQTRAN